MIDHGWAEIEQQKADRRLWAEYDSAAEWCAKRGIQGKTGDKLPELLSSEVAELIQEDQDAFEERVRDMAYGMAMETCGRVCR